jgi:hypothetical protein
MPLVRPTSDLVTTGWTPSAGGDLFAVIDEEVADDGDYVSANAGAGLPYAFGLGASVPIGTHTVRVRVRTSAGMSGFRVVLLTSGDAEVGASAYQAIDDTWTTYELSVVTSGVANRARIELLPEGALSITDGVLSITDGIVSLT